MNYKNRTIILLFFILYPIILLASYNIPSNNLINPLSGNTLIFDGVSWTNTTGNTFQLFNDDTIIIPAGAGPETIPLYTLLSSPNTSVSTVTDSVVVNNNTLLLESYLYNTILNGTSISAGTWQFDTYCSASSSANTSEILTEIYRVISGGVDTIDITGGPGTSRTATALGTPFVAGDANVDQTLSGYLHTPNGQFQITAHSTDSVVTILVPATYTNETTVEYSVHRRLFENTTGDINNTSITLNLTTNSQPVYTITSTDKLAARYFGRTNRTSNTTISYTHNGNTQYNHFHMPLVLK